MTARAAPRAAARGERGACIKRRVACRAAQRPRSAAVVVKDVQADRSDHARSRTGAGGCLPAAHPLVCVAGRSPGWCLPENRRRNRLPKAVASVAQRFPRGHLPLRGQHRLCRRGRQRTCFPFHPRCQNGGAGTSHALPAFFMRAAGRDDTASLYPAVALRYRRVASQHRIAPPQTMAAPCQKAQDSDAPSSHTDSAEDSTGMKYEAPARMVTLPCRMPTFQAA
ncbi:Uncharacterised protein [uncultured Comamonas sp.]|nr:Uncharacterised protein [uncultured Comamonas sp.]